MWSNYIELIVIADCMIYAFLFCIPTHRVVVVRFVMKNYFDLCLYAIVLISLIICCVEIGHFVIMYFSISEALYQK